MFTYLGVFLECSRSIASLVDKGLYSFPVVSRNTSEERLAKARIVQHPLDLVRLPIDVASQGAECCSLRLPQTTTYESLANPLHKQMRSEIGSGWRVQNLR